MKEQQYGVVRMGTGSAGPGFGFWLTGKLGRGGAWVVHGIGAQCWLGVRGRGLFTLACDVIIGRLLHEIFFPDIT